MQKASNDGAAFIGVHEGFVPHWYPDPIGVGTIGAGYTWASDAFREWWRINKPGVEFGPGATITRAESNQAMRYLLDREYGATVARFLDGPVPQHVFDGMTSVVFNAGPAALGWRWAMQARVGNYPESARILRTTATTAGGRELAGLVRRRKEEAMLIEHAIYTGIRSTPHAPVDAMADGILMRREEGPAVATLIRDLHALGYYHGVMDDIFGPGTEEAVLRFQRINGLKADGIVGPRTRAALDEALARKGKTPVTPSAPADEPAMPAQRHWLAVLIEAIAGLFRK